MTKRNLVSKIFAIALVFTVLGSMLGGLQGSVNAEATSGKATYAANSDAITCASDESSDNPRNQQIEVGEFGISVSDSPDPFNPLYETTTITVSNDGTIPARVTLSIEAVNRTWQWQVEPSNSVQAIWDGRDSDGNIVPAGTYNYTAIGIQWSAASGSVGSWSDTETGTITVVLGDIWYVPDDYANIQWAVDNATSGDTIIVRDGTYTENIDVDKDHLTIKSENGADSTTVQAANSKDHVFYVTADYVNISGFTIEETHGAFIAGICFDRARDCNVSSNIIVNNTNGISMDHYSSYNGITNNNISNNLQWGIYLHYSSCNNDIINNNISSNGCGIYLCWYSNNNRIMGNTLIDDGLFVSNSYHNIVEDNTVNDKPLLYFEDVSDRDILDGGEVGEVILVNCRNVTVANLNLRNTKVGIQLVGTHQSKIVNNTMMGNVGIFINSFGIYLDSSSNNEIINNTILDGNGIYLYFSNNNKLINNNLNMKNDIDILLYSSSNNEIVKNSISNNKRGILSYYASNCKVYLNNFINNTNNIYSSKSTNNTWNSPEEITYTYNGNTYTNYLGNYWSDFEGRYPGAEEIDETGIWDTPYSIDSDADNYPLVEPFGNYEIGGDTTSPTVSSVSPEDSATDVNVATNITGTFSEPVDSSTITTASFALEAEGTLVSGTVSYDPASYTTTFTPDANLDYNHTYTVTLGTAITDLAGNPLTEAYTWSFTTEQLLSATIKVDKTGVWSGDEVTFNGSASSGRIVSYEWNFTDGTILRGSGTPGVEKHRFRGAMNEAKDYTVKLTVEDDKGTTASDNMTVSVYPLKRYIPVYSSLSHLLPPPPLKVMEVTVYYNWVDEIEGEDEYIVSQVHLDSVGSLNFALYMLSINDDGQKIWSKIHRGVGKEDISFTYPFNVPRDCVKTIGDEHFEGLAVGPGSSLNFVVDGVELGLELRPSFFHVSSMIELGPGKQTEVPSIYPEGEMAGILATVASPVELQAYDSAGNVTGLVNEEVKEEIPNSMYDEESKTCVIFSPEDIDSYHYEIAGTEEGTYGLDIASIEDGEAATVTATDIPTSANATHQYTINWSALAQGEEGVTVQVDSDGDGDFENAFTADSELTQDEFLYETIPELLKEDAISKLGGIKPSRNAAQHLINNSIRSINKSLSDELWADGSHLNSNMTAGALVFDMEKAAVLNLKAAERIDPTIEAGVGEVIAKLTRADKLLSITAIDDAKGVEVEDPWKRKIVDWQIAKAEEELDKAYGYLDNDVAGKAITHFKLAWIHAQVAIKVAEPTGTG